jgi:DNA-binding beta-propeller fold protein YncE
VQDRFESIEANLIVLARWPEVRGDCPGLDGLRPLPPCYRVVTNFGTGNLVTIDFHTNQILHTLALDGRPVGVGGYNAAGTLGYVVDFGHASLSVQASLNNALSLLSGDLSPYVGNGPGHMTMFDPSTGQKIGKSIEVGKGPTSLVVIPD